MSLGNVLGAVAPIAAGYFTGGLSSGIMGLSAGAMSGMAGGALAGMGIAALSGDDILMGGLSGGMGGYGGGGLAAANSAAKLTAQQAMGTGAFNSGNAAMAGYTGPSSMMSTLSSSGAGAGAGAGAGSLGTKTANAIANPMGRAGVSTNMLGSGSTPVANLDMSNAGGYQYTAQDFAGSGPTAQFGTDYGISDVAGQLGGGDPMAGYGKMALTAAPVLSAAFTPEPLSYDDYNKDEKYDPNRTLNLNMDTGIKDALTRDTGLRLYADGGPVSTGADSSGLPIGTTYKSMIASGVDPLTAATQLKLPNVPGGNYPDYVNPLATPYEQTGIASLSGSTDEERLASLRSPTPVYGGGYDESEFIRSAGENSGVYATPSGGGTTRRIYEKMRNEGYAGGGTVQPQAGGGGGGGGGVNNLLRNMMEGTAQNMQTTGVPEGMSIADVIRAGRGYMPGPKGGVKLAQGGYLDGGMLPGDGMSDDVPANIDGEQEAALSQGEFVVPADVVSHLGNGSSDAGSKKLYAMMDKVRQARTGNKQQGKQINPERYMPA